MNDLVLYGNGGHAKVIKDLVQKQGREVSYCFDLQHPYDEQVLEKARLLIAIGQNDLRKKIAKEVKHDFAILIHPTAVIAEDVEIGEGSVVLAHAVIQAGSKIGKHCIVNANVVIDHDVKVHDFVNIYPGAYVGGGCIITESTVIEPNQVVPRNTTI